MQDDEDHPTGQRRYGLIWTTVKAVVAIAVISVAATQFLSGSRLDRQGMGVLTAMISGPVRDPVTTGSIASANQVRLDPCVAPLRR